MFTQSASWLMAIVFGVALTAGGQEQALRPPPWKSRGQTVRVPDQAIKVTITAGGGMFGPARERFRVGEAIPIVISMTST